MARVTDPALLAELDAAPSSSGLKVADPAILAQLEPAPVPQGETALRGLLQGASQGFGDELAAGGRAHGFGVPGAEMLAGAEKEPVTYRGALAQERAANEAAQRASPKTYLATQVAGTVLPSLGAPVSGARGLLATAGQGLLEGAGYSDANSLSGLAGDTTLGVGLGAAGFGVGALLGATSRWLAGRAAHRLTAAQAKAAAGAAKEIREEIASAAGRYGGEMQKGSRQVENLPRVAPAMTARQRADYAALQAAGITGDLERQIAGSTLEALPGQAATIAARRAELQALQQAAPAAEAARAAEALRPSVKQDVRSLIKSYGEPIVMSATLGGLGDLAGGDWGGRMGAAGGFIFGRTRAGKALANRASKPGNQVLLADAIRRLGERSQQASRLAPAYGLGVVPLVTGSEEQ